jgi:signal transduction histidine kinase
MRHKAPGEIKQNFLERLTLMDDEVDRCIQVTDRLLKLSTPPAELPELVSLQEIIPEVVSLLSAEAERVNTDIQLDLNGSLRVITSDGDMRMLVLNLVQNAFHAMPGGGTLRISGRIQDDNILLQFEDTGVGIASNDLQRIFQPFWSRRADGVHGTGLGLPICREILRRHGGHITVSSKLGEYSSFVVTLPWAESTTEAA